MSDQPLCRVTLFGGASIHKGGEKPELGAKQVEALAYLGINAAVHPQRRLYWLDLAQMLWYGTEDFEEVEPKWRVATSRLRTALRCGEGGKNPLPTDRKQRTIWLDQSLVTVDAVTFKETYDKALEAKDYEKKIEMFEVAVAASRGRLAGGENSDPDFRNIYGILKGWQCNARYQLALCYETIGNAQKALDYVHEALALGGKTGPTKALLRRLEADDERSVLRQAGGDALFAINVAPPKAGRQRERPPFPWERDYQDAALHQEVYLPADTEFHGDPVQAAPFPERVSASSSVTPEQITAAIQSRASETCQAIQPFILSRIDRPQSLDALQRRLRQQAESRRSEALFLVGHAGYGKTILLGDLYSALSPDGGYVVGFVLCEDIASGETEEAFDRALGSALTGFDITITKILEALASDLRQVVLLLDTLDLLLSVPFANGLKHCFRRWTGYPGVSVVCTCRTYDFEDYLQPLPGRMPGVPAHLAHIGPFSSPEVKQAVLAYFSTSIAQDVSVTTGEVFAGALLTLSTDNRSLAEITHNPLLLALMCELYARFGPPPSDLTVNKLYERFWDAKVRQERALDMDETERHAAADERVRLCLEMACLLFGLSGERLHEAVSRNALGIERSLRRTDAYRRLSSERVFETDRLLRVRFFHQTFEEFAIACWLNTEDGQGSREALLAGLREAATQSQHWWPTVRQYLTLADAPEFDRWAQALQALSPIALRTVALATVAREDAFGHTAVLLGIASQWGDSYQEALLGAMNSATSYFDAPIQNVVRSLLAQSSTPVATKAAVQIGERLAGARQAAGWLDQAMHAVRSRSTARARGGTDDRSEVAGKLLECFLSDPEREIHPAELRTLREHYGLFAEGMREKLVRLCLDRDPAEDGRRSLLAEMMAWPLPRNLREEASDLLNGFLPDFAAMDEEGVWQWWLSSFAATPPQRWPIVFAKAMGCRTALLPGLVERLVTQLGEGSEAQVSQSSVALQEATRHGLGHLVLATMDRYEPQLQGSTRRKAFDFIRQDIASGSADGQRLSKRKQALASKTTRELLVLARANDLDAVQLLNKRTMGEDAASVADFLPLLASKKAGVRVASLQALLQLLGRQRDFAEDQLAWIAKMLDEATENTTVRYYCRLIGRWGRLARRMDDRLMEAVIGIPARLQAAGTYDGGTGRYVLETLATIATVGHDSQTVRVGEGLRALLSVADLSEIGNWKRVFSLFERIAPALPNYLSTLAGDLKQRAARGDLWTENAKAVAEALWRIEGRNSDTLHQLWKSDWCPESVKVEIAGLLGLR